MYIKKNNEVLKKKHSDILRERTFFSEKIKYLLKNISITLLCEHMEVSRRGRLICDQQKVFEKEYSQEEFSQ